MIPDNKKYELKFWKRVGLVLLGFNPDKVFSQIGFNNNEIKNANLVIRLHKIYDEYVESSQLKVDDRLTIEKLIEPAKTVIKEHEVRRNILLETLKDKK